jgi:hypothetical protein
MIETIVQAIPTAIISVLGFGGFVYWTKRHFDALKGAIDAQHKTIEGQSAILNNFESLNKTMKTVIDVFDPPTMLNRIESIKKLADHDMEVYKRGVDLDKEEDIEKWKMHFVGVSLEVYTVFIDLATKTMPYIPQDKRIDVIDSLNMRSLTTEIVEETNKKLRDIAHSAPYQSNISEALTLITGEFSITQEPNQIRSEGTAS